ncbi:MFS transporter [Amantichitinum ursilacus]|uniref:Inner membrane metabolite transport protein YhjE n=1 Tax=Amantichitinum ursilacus TaxID=857265 RepID=A0A0N0XHQ1_9NEIS|nr:MFS transporter [Amantichitinum ursilacus]KPC52074.1 Inner membrane metabolite transport protein YhjE [Amantichitinum ursilacus]
MTTSAQPPANSTARVAVASFIGTAIEFFDFYIFATAAALIIGPTFFPKESSTAQALNAFVTFGIAFLARPLGSALFGHFGDRIGRKSTLVASLTVMGVSTTLIGFLPGHDSIGDLAPLLLCVLRFGQGIGLGGEWGGAALLATENAPPGKRAWFGMFPQLGPSVGFLLANGLFLGLAVALSDDQFKGWGWRVPFIFSAVLVALGLYVRLKLHETPVFAQAMQRQQRVKVPLAALFGRHWLPVLQGAFSMVVCYALFYISTVFALSYGTKTLHFSRPQFLGMLCFAVLFMALATPLSAWASDRFGRKPVLLLGTALAMASGFAMQPLLGAGTFGPVTLFLVIELFLMGFTFGPMGALLPEIFPTPVRYSGAGIAYNLGGIIGASIAPYIAQVLVERGGLSWVGGYVSVAALLSFIAVLSMRETREADLAQVAAPDDGPASAHTVIERAGA